MTQEKFYAEKKLFILNELELNEDIEKKFWEVYFKYDAQRLILSRDIALTNRKLLQNKIIEDRIRIYGPHILNVILGCTDTRLSEDLEGDKLNPDDISKWIVDMLLCDNMYFQSVTIDAKQLNYKSKQ